MPDIKLRPYQEECLSLIPPKGKHLIQAFTGAGKTVIFSRIPYKKRMLIISHREELCRQPIRYFPKGKAAVEHSNEYAGDAEVVSSTVQTMLHRKQLFAKDEFDVIIIDEAHHSAARSYRDLLQYFKPRLLLGFTATPNRSDGRTLNDIFDDIIFEKDLIWGIQHGYLSNIRAYRIDIGYDLTGVRNQLGDYAPAMLDKAVNIEKANKAIVQAYQRYAIGPTVIFCTSVDHAKTLASMIPNAEYVVGGEDRNQKLHRFVTGETKCLTNCMVLTEGTDLPCIETIMIARPTQSEPLYTQMVGRGLRLYEGKEILTLIDLVGVSNKPIVSAPSLIGADIDMVPPEYREYICGDLFDFPKEIMRLADTPETWIRNAELIDLWAKKRKYNLHNVNYFRTAMGELVLSKPKLRIPAPDLLGYIQWQGKKRTYQSVLDEVYRGLTENHQKDAILWDCRRARAWQRQRATMAQLKYINKAVPELKRVALTKGEAAQVLTRLFIGKDGLNV